MEALFSPIITALSLSIVLVLLLRWRKPAVGEVPLEKITEVATRQVITAVMGVSPMQAERIQPKESNEAPKSLLEALLIYFSQLHTSRVVLHVLAKDRPDERIRFPQLAKAVRQYVEPRDLDDIPETAMRAALRLLVGADLVNGTDGFKVTTLGKQLQRELDARMD